MQYMLCRPIVPRNWPWISSSSRSDLHRSLKVINYVIIIGRPYMACY